MMSHLPPRLPLAVTLCHTQFPDEIKISPAAHDLIRRLMCDVDDRLGTNGVQVRVGVSAC
jgi:hypothetical protein